MADPLPKETASMEAQEGPLDWTFGQVWFEGENVNEKTENPS